MQNKIVFLVTKRLAIAVLLISSAFFAASSFARGGGGHFGDGFHSSGFHSSSFHSSSFSSYHSSPSPVRSAPTRTSFGGFGARTASTPVVSPSHQPVLTSSLTQSSAHHQALATYDARTAKAAA